MTVPASTQPLATIVIATKNRCADLRRAVDSSLRQTVALEIIVIDDGSSDDTFDVIRREFPSVIVHRSEESLGYIVQRNRGAALAKAPIVVSIDDDAVFSSPRVVEQTLDQFDHDRVGAVAIPFVDVLKGDAVQQLAPGNGDVFVTDAYVGTAHALRRELFLQLGGYREFLLHQGEERDFCIRLLNAGYVVRLGRGDPIHHFESPRRNTDRMDIHGRRNDVLFAWHNVPLPYLPCHMLGTSLYGLAFGVRVGRPWKMLRGLARGYHDCWFERTKRRPTAARAYCLSRKLRSRVATRLTDIADELALLGPTAPKLVNG